MKNPPPLEEQILSDIGASGLLKVQEMTKFYEEQYDSAGENKLGALLGLYDLVDEETEESKVQEQASCKKGCAFCCHIKVDCTLDEAELILDYCKEHKIVINTKKLDRQKDLKAVEFPLSPDGRCIFLKHDNTCGIYPVRPFACRRFYVKNDPKFCNAAKYPKFNVAVLNNYHTAAIGMSVMESNRKRSRRYGVLAAMILEAIKVDEKKNKPL